MASNTIKKTAEELAESAEKHYTNCVKPWIKHLIIKFVPSTMVSKYIEDLSESGEGIISLPGTHTTHYLKEK